MAKQTINTGGVVDSPTAESIGSAFTKVNAMTAELFTAFSLGGRLAIDLDASPDTIRDAFIKTNTNLSALYADQSLAGAPVINVGDAPDDVAAESIYTAFTKVNQGMTALYAAILPAPSGDYYVATTGADSNPGTLGQPFRTINKGVSVLSAGNTLTVRSGTYVESVLIGKIPAGTSWLAPVRVEAYPGETVWIKPAGGGDAVIEIGLAQQYIEIDGINMDATNGSTTVLKTNWISTNHRAHHIRVQNCEMIASPAPGTAICIDVAGLVGAIGYNEFRNIVAHGGHGAGFYIMSPNTIVDGCDIYDIGDSTNGGAGIQAYNGYVSSLPTNAVFSNNRLHDFTRYSGTDRRHWAINTGSGSGTKIFNNVIWNIQGTGTAALYLYKGTGTVIYHNTVYGNERAGIAVEALASGTTVRNNIAYNNAGGNYVNNGGVSVADHNVFTQNPLFINAAAHDFRLQAGSPALHTGTQIALVTTSIDGVSRPQGAGTDIGAHEQ